jgi:hypothetical protein
MKLALLVVVIFTVVAAP